MTAETNPAVRAAPASRRWVLLSVAIASEVSASLAMKAAGTSPGWYALVVVGYLTAFVMLSLVLRTGMALGVAYGIWGATGVALTAALATVLFAEPLTLMMIGGIALIVAGVLCVEMGSH